MKKKLITKTLGIILVICSIIFFVQTYEFGGIVLLVVGSSLIYLSFDPGRTKIVVFGHICVFVAGMASRKLNYRFLRRLASVPADIQV